MLLPLGTSAFSLISTSSAMLWTFGMPLSTLSSPSWIKFPGTLSPNGSCSYMNLPHGVLNIVIRLLFLSSMTCQYPDLVSCRMKNMELAGMVGCHQMSCCTTGFFFIFLLRSFGSGKYLGGPFVFFTRTMELTHSVYPLTSMMMPSLSSPSGPAL